MLESSYQEKPSIMTRSVLFLQFLLFELGLIQDKTLVKWVPYPSIHIFMHYLSDYFILELPNSLNVLLGELPSAILKERKIRLADLLADAAFRSSQIGFRHSVWMSLLYEITESLSANKALKEGLIFFDVLDIVGEIENIIGTASTLRVELIWGRMILTNSAQKRFIILGWDLIVIEILEGVDQKD